MFRGGGGIGNGFDSAVFTNGAATGIDGTGISGDDEKYTHGPDAPSTGFTYGPDPH